MPPDDPLPPFAGGGVSPPPMYPKPIHDQLAALEERLIGAHAAMLAEMSSALFLCMIALRDGDPPKRDVEKLKAQLPALKELFVAAGLDALKEPKP